MIMGGIPYYLDKIEKGMSFSQNIDNIFFKKRARLWDEFTHLYASLFDNSEPHLSDQSCFGHIRCGYRQCSWRGKDESGKRSQIDLLIDRRDGVIDLCEAKFASGLYSITKGYKSELADKIEVFRNATKTNKSVHLVIVTHSVYLTIPTPHLCRTRLLSTTCSCIEIDDRWSVPSLLINRQYDLGLRRGIFDDSLRL